MKIIDLLNKIANGEEVPKKIKYKNVIWCFSTENKTYYMEDTTIELFYLEELTERLNEEVEILEEEKKIPEKLDPLQKEYMTIDDIKFTFSNSEMILVDKINSIIDYIKSKGE